MNVQKLNRTCGILLMFLSAVALLTVLSGYTQPPQPEEGAAAHIFQLAIVALAPVLLLFVATADWTQASKQIRRLAFPVAALSVAFGALYYLEHYR